MTVQTKTIEYSDGDTVLEGLLAWDDAQSTSRPGVLVAHAWGGRGEFEDNKAIALAELGYAGFSLDLYGKGVSGNNPEENTKLMQPFLDDRALLQRRMALSVDALRGADVVDGSKVVATGYCFGGMAVLDLARSGAQVTGVISFHGLFNAPGNTAGNKINAKVLALHGWNDPMVPPDAVTELAQELTDAGADWQIHGYGNTLHAFTNPEANFPDLGAMYHADSDRRSWQSMRNFLNEVF